MNCPSKYDSNTVEKLNPSNTCRAQQIQETVKMATFYGSEKDRFLYFLWNVQQPKNSYKKISFCNDSYPNVNGKDKSVSINFILLLTKYFIFKCKNRKETPCMFQFEISISERRGLEEIIAFNRNITDKHIEKWQHLY